MQLTEEVRDDFLLSVKKGIVDFALQDPNKCELGIHVYESPERTEMREICKSFSLNYPVIKSKLHKNLHTINPCIAQVLDLWQRQFRYVISFKFSFLLTNFQHFTANTC